MKRAADILNGQGAYRSKLASKEWREFTKRVRANRGNSCACCRRSGVIVQVHHIYYIPGIEPWQYPDDALIVLCESCHHQLHDELKQFRQHVFGKLNPQSFKIINRALEVALTQYDPLTFAHALCEIVSNPRLIDNHARAWSAPSINTKLAGMA